MGPSPAQDSHLHVLPAESQRLVTTPHVEIEDAPLNLRAGIHHGGHAAVPTVANGDVEHAPTGSSDGSAAAMPARMPTPDAVVVPCNTRWR